MCILQIITLCELGGAQTVVINLANELSYNNKVIVVAGEGDGKMFSQLNENVIIERIPSLVHRLSPINEIKTVFAMKQIYRKYKPDIIHLHSSKAGLLGRLAFPPHKIVYTVHGFDSIRIAHRKFLPLEILLQKRCKAIVGVSRYDKKNLISEGIVNNVFCIYNGISRPPLLKQDPFTHYSKYEKKVLCIARLSPQKNHNLFIEVAKLLPQYAFIWIGNQTTPDFTFPANVFFMGNIPNAGSYTQYADLFMLPSNYEGLPMAIIEALSNGVPVVASDVGGVSELLDNKNGYAVKNNAEHMAKNIEYILSYSQEKYKCFSMHAKETYIKHFTVEKMVYGYLAIYHDIIKSQKKTFVT